jgi:hypothetical protein
VVGDVTGETHQLIQSLPHDDTVAVGVDVGAMIGARCVPIDQDLDFTGLPSGTGPRTKCRSRAWKR